VTARRTSSERTLDAATSRSVVARISESEKLPSRTGERLLAELLKFLDLSAEMTSRGDDRRLVPSVQVDAAWHAFILHTRAYAQFCESAYGTYLHHDPTSPDEPVELGGVLEYLRTRVLMEERYGGLDEELWPLP
jgi:hypothetical protein